MNFPNTLNAPQSVRWNGRLYWFQERDSKHGKQGYYFTTYKRKGDRSRSSLHQDLYIAFHGPIPEGHDVHHRDENSLNNDPSNLETMHHGKHMSHHVSQYREQNIEKLRLGLPAAAEWHRSEKGREWHRFHASAQWTDEERAKRAFRTNCELCGVAFTGQKKGSRFCSQNCRIKNAYRDRRYITLETRCAWCGTTFMTSRHRPRITCSRKCTGSETQRRLKQKRAQASA